MVMLPVLIKITPYHPEGFTVTWLEELKGTEKWQVVRNKEQLMALLESLLKEEEAE